MSFGQSQSATGGGSAPQRTVAPMTQEQGEEILNELRLIRKQLEDRNYENAQNKSAPRSSKEVRLNVDPHWFALGRADAPVTVVEFSDFECPYCNLFNRKTFWEIKKAYIDTGKVRFVSLEFPLEVHAKARSAALAALCAGSQGHYWEMRKSMIAGSPNFDADVLDHEAEALSLNMNEFRDCVKSGRPSTAIQRDMAEGERIGVNGTPEFLIGKTGKGVIEGVRADGAQPYAQFASLIDSALAESEGNPGGE
jgi:protein-disulfide isomerase